MRLCFSYFALVPLAIAETHTFPSETIDPSQASGDEQTLWDLERAYWRYVEHNDSAAYSDFMAQGFF